VDTSILRLCTWVARYALRRWVGLGAVAATILLKIGLDVLKPWPMKVLVDHALGGQPLPAAMTPLIAVLPGAETREGLVTWTVASTVVLFLAGWLLGVATSYANIGFGLRMVYDLASDLFSHLQRLSLRFHSRKSIGDSIRRVTTDCGCVSVIVKDGLLPLATSVVSLLVMFGVMWRLEPRLTLLSLAVVPWMVLVLRRYMNPLMERSYRQQEAEGRLYDLVEQTLSAVPVVQAFGREADADRRLAETTDAAIDASVSVSLVGLKFRILTAAATAVGTAAVLWLGAQSVLDGSLTVGTILVFVAYLGSLYGPLETVMYSPSTTQGAAGSARRVLEILETERDVQDRPGALPLTRVTGHVAFDDVSFEYEPGRPVLHRISLDVRAGETVAIVGRTGAGKSTLVSLLPRFYDPLTGRVTLDGHDLRDVELASLRAQIAVVLQEPFLFPFSIADNIAYGRPDATRVEVAAAARAANASAFIERLPAGYDTVLGERGATLSGGERQRLSIARALLKDAPILVLDEPTSSVDAETERQLLEALDRLMEGRTTFIIAHRLSTVRKADRILVMDQGRIVESGRHDELVASRGLYARFHDLQFRDVDESR
jgi:ATP-binding cassette subfamily B protein/subfamily B ATP-binding cassette protein MsbA